MSLYSSIQRSASSLEILLLRRIVSAITVIVTESCDTFTLNLLRLLSSDTTHIQTTTSLSVKKKFGFGFMVLNTTFNNIEPISCMAVSFIGGGNQSTWRKAPTSHKSLTNFIT